MFPVLSHPKRPSLALGQTSRPRRSSSVPPKNARRISLLQRSPSMSTLSSERSAEGFGRSNPSTTTNQGRIRFHLPLDKSTASNYLPISLQHYLWELGLLVFSLLNHDEQNCETNPTEVWLDSKDPSSVLEDPPTTTGFPEIHPLRNDQFLNVNTRILGCSDRGLVKVRIKIHWRNQHLCTVTVAERHQAGAGFFHMGISYHPVALQTVYRYEPDQPTAEHSAEFDFHLATVMLRSDVFDQNRLNIWIPNSIVPSLARGFRWPVIIGVDTRNIDARKPRGHEPRLCGCSIECVAVLNNAVLDWLEFVRTPNEGRVLETGENGMIEVWNISHRDFGARNGFIVVDGRDLINDECMLVPSPEQVTESTLSSWLSIEGVEA